ncbi:hypothetical protein CGLO_10587 [Colletotrichum gloeosporioides Cg-14]|uniref:Uncharacterized protein n=1 Tax=Colletotrichum gloeosporioides (strain Cg-14) TaxID=1237896 RepID=T0K3E0_COLGC|nr:hypothetical protein CGLO_10587 [Colletotrichum gloeosporioides Cg-14]
MPKGLAYASPGQQAWDCHASQVIRDFLACLSRSEAHWSAGT